MNNDLRNNHSSMSSNKYIANRKFPQLNRYYQESHIRDQGMLDTQSKGNKTIFFDSDNDKRPSNTKELLISKSISKYPTNYAAGPHPFRDNVNHGYYVSSQVDKRYDNPNIPLFIRQTKKHRIEVIKEDYDPRNRNDYYYRPNIKNGGDEIEDEERDDGEEEEFENGNEYDNISPSKEGNYNQYIGDGIVRNNIPNFSPNQNGQNIPYYRKKYLSNNYGPRNEFEDENENEEEYMVESPTKQYNTINYAYNQPYKRRRILGNLADSASSEAYAKNDEKSPNTDKSSSIIYKKPKSNYNNNLNNGISTEERGIESKKESTNNAPKNGSYLTKIIKYKYIETDGNDKNNKNNYDEDSENVVEPPLYHYKNNETIKGGKVDLNNYTHKSKEKKVTNEETDLLDEYNIDENKMENVVRLQKYIKSHIKIQEIKIIKIQSLWRGRSTRRIMTLYHDLDEFIYLLSKVHFNHFSDNFYYFINQLFNVYKANTLENNPIESQDEEKEEKEEDEKEQPKEKEEEDIKEIENEEEEIIEPTDKNYEELLTDYNNLQKKYNDLINDKNKVDKSSTKKSFINNNDIVSVPGETTIGTIKTDNRKFKFKAPNTGNNDNLTFSNDYNVEDIEVNKEYERRFYTPNLEDEDSFNDNSKDKRYSYSSIHSEENSKYFDNEQPTSNKRGLGFKNKGRKKIGLITLNIKKEKILINSPSIDTEKPSRGNSKNKNNNIDNPIETETKITNIIIKREEEFGIDRLPEDKEKKLLENKNIYDKYVNDYSKDLFIVKNNKINLENEKEEDKKLYCFDNELMFPENENNLELVAPKKTNDEKIKDIFSNTKLYNQLKVKFTKIIVPEKPELTENYGDSFTIKNERPDNALDKLKNEIDQNINNLEIIQNTHRNFSNSQLDLETNEFFIGERESVKLRKKLKKIVPVSENEIIFEKSPKPVEEPIPYFSNEKTIPSLNEDYSFTIPRKPKKKPKRNIEYNSFTIESKPKKKPRQRIENDSFTIYNKPKKKPRKIIENHSFTINQNIPKKKPRQRIEKNSFTISQIKPKKEPKQFIETNSFSIETKPKKKPKQRIETNSFSIQTKPKKKPRQRIVKNSFTIENIPKEPKQLIFDRDKLIIDYNNELNINETRPIKEPEKEKEVVYLEFNDNKFKRLRRSKRTKDTYFTIKRDPNYKKDNNELDDKDKNKDLQPINENNFEIKSEYYYIETNDTPVPLIKEKIVKETVYVPNKEFNDLQYIPENELTIISKNKKERNDEIDKNNDFIIDGESKKWGYLNPVANDEFTCNNDFPNRNRIYENDKIPEEENENDTSLYITPLEGFDIIDKKEDKEIPLTPCRENDIKVKGSKLKLKEKEAQIDIVPKKVNTSTIIIKKPNNKFLNNKKGVEDCFSIYGTKNNRNFDDNLIDKDNNIELNIIQNDKDNKKDLYLIKDNNCEFNLKNNKKKQKENATETDFKKEFDNLSSVPNDEFSIKYNKNKPKEQHTEMDNEVYDDDKRKNEILENIPNDNITIEGLKKKMKDTGTDIDNDFYNLQPDNNNNEINYEPTIPRDHEIVPNEGLNLIAPEKEIIMEKSKLDDIHLVSRNRAFPELGMNNCLSQTINGKEKDKVFDTIYNEPITLGEDRPENKDKDYTIEYNEMSILNDKNKDNENLVENPRTFNDLDINKIEDYNILGNEKEEDREKKPEKPKKIKMKEKETEIDDDLLNIIPEKCNDFIYDETEPINEEKPRKKDKKKERETEIDNDLYNNIPEKCNDFNYDQPQRFNEEKPRKNKTKEKETEIDDDLLNPDNFYYDNEKSRRIRDRNRDQNIPNSIENYELCIKSSPKNKDFEKENKDEINYEPKDRKFSDLDINKCEDQIFSKKEREPYESTYNEDIRLDGKERQSYENTYNEPIKLDAKERQPYENIYNEPIKLDAKERQPYQNTFNEPIMLDAKERQPYENTQNEPIRLDGKDRQPYENTQNEPILLNAKEREPFENIKNDEFIFNGKEREPFENIKNDDFIYNGEVNGPDKKSKGKEKDIQTEPNIFGRTNEDKNLENIRNESLLIKPDKKKSKETETEIDKDLNSNLMKDYNDNFAYGPKPRRQNEISRNDGFNIDDTNKRDLNLAIDEQQPLYIENNKDKPNNEFNKDLLSPCNPETFEIRKDNAPGQNDEKPNKDRLNDLEPTTRLELFGNPKFNNDKLCPENASNHNYIYHKKKNKESATDTDNLDNNKNKDLYIDNNNKIELLEEPDKLGPNKQDDYNNKIADRLNNMQPIQNDKFDILNPISDKNKEPENKQFKNIEEAPGNSFSIIPPEDYENRYDNQLNNKPRKVETKDACVQTPKLRPANKDPQKVVFHEIKTIMKKEPKPVKRKELEIAPSSKYKLISNADPNRNRNNLNNIKEEDEKEVDDETYRRGEN